MTLTITAADIGRFAPKARPELINALLENQDVLADAGILENRLRLAHFMATCAHETAGLSQVRERMNYTANRMRQVWPSRFRDKSDAELAPLVADPVKLANAVYGDRLGNRKGTNDGWDYRGGGFIQVTGRENVTKLCKAAGIAVTADVLDDPVSTLKMACAYWTKTNCNEWADKNDALRVAKAVNLGSARAPGTPVGMKDRLHWLSKAIKVWDTDEPALSREPEVSGKAEQALATAQSLYQSRSLWAQILATISIIAGVITDYAKKAWDWLMWVVGILPDIKEKTGEALSTAQEIAGWFHVNIGAISIVIAAVCIVVAFYRHAQLRLEAKQ